MSKMIKIPLILSLVTLLTSALLMVSEKLTHEKIFEQKQLLLRNSLKQLIPDKDHDNDLLSSSKKLFEPDKLGHRKEQNVYIGTMNGITSVVAIPVTSRDGYSGDIDIIVGIKSDGKITSVKIIEQHETPGLGDIIEEHKSDWLLQFPNKSLNNVTKKGWAVKRDDGEFDQITGATITPRAVVEAIYKALNYFKSHQDFFDITIKDAKKQTNLDSL